MTPILPSLQLAYGALRTNKVRAALTMLGVIIGVAAVIATIAVGNIQDWDQVNTIVASGRADLCALARPHLVDPHFTLRAAIEQGYRGPGVVWPPQYLAAR